MLKSGPWKDKRAGFNLWKLTLSQKSSQKYTGASSWIQLLRHMGNSDYILWNPTRSLLYRGSRNRGTIPLLPHTQRWGPRSCRFSSIFLANLP